MQSKNRCIIFAAIKNVSLLELFGQESHSGSGSFFDFFSLCSINYLYLRPDNLIEMQKVTVYVDGFNFYYGLKRKKLVDNDWQRFYWIDFVKLFELFIRSDQIIHKVVYFTTPSLNEQKRNRQKLLLLANRLINKERFEVIEGKFYENELFCPICKSRYTKPEEKRTDVNICAQMMRDCGLNKTDVLILVSADSDLVPPLELIREDHPAKKIKIYFPPDNFSNDLNNFMKANKGKTVLLENNKPKFFKSIMPDIVTKDGKSYTIPAKWKVI